MVWPKLHIDQFLSEPWDEVGNLRREVNRLFSDFFGEPGRGSFPALNVWRNNDEVIVTAEIPGMSPEDLDISVENDNLTLRGSRKPDELKEGEQCHRQERSVGSFVRNVRLPYPVNAEKVAAHYEKGILRITLPRAEAHKPRQIPVKVS